MFSFGRLLFLRFFLLTLNMCYFSWKRFSKKTIIALILKHFAQQINAHSKSASETLKQEVKSVKS